ncbi:hypothetical protein BD414DRAFT_536441 [Trametes punicea]|nr:hypothetical protein BD414DRAFT_536441 [Trametes punicea]
MSSEHREEFATTKGVVPLDDDEDMSDEWHSAQSTPSPSLVDTHCLQRPEDTNRSEERTLSPTSSTTSYQTCPESSSGLTGVISSVNLHPTPTPTVHDQWQWSLNPSPAPPYVDTNYSPAPSYASRPPERSADAPSTHPLPTPRTPAQVLIAQDARTPMLSPLPQPFGSHNTLGLNMTSGRSTPSAVEHDDDATLRYEPDGRAKRYVESHGVDRARSVRRYVEVDESITLRAEAIRLTARVASLEADLMASQQAQLAAQSNVITLQNKLSCLRQAFEDEVSKRCTEREGQLQEMVCTIVERQTSQERAKLAEAVQAHERQAVEAARRLDEGRAQLEAAHRELEREKSERAALAAQLAKEDETRRGEEVALGAQRAEYDERSRQQDERHRQQEAALEARRAEYEERYHKQEAALEAQRSACDEKMKKLQDDQDHLERGRTEIEKARAEIEKARTEIEADRAKLHACIHRLESAPQASGSAVPKPLSHLSAVSSLASGPPAIIPGSLPDNSTSQNSQPARTSAGNEQEQRSSAGCDAHRLADLPLSTAKSSKLSKDDEHDVGGGYSASAERMLSFGQRHAQIAPGMTSGRIDTENHDPPMPMPGTFYAPFEIRQAPSRSTFRWQSPYAHKQQGRSAERSPPEITVPGLSLLDEASYHMDSDDMIDDSIMEQMDYNPGRPPAIRQPKKTRSQRHHDRPRGTKAARSQHKAHQRRGGRTEDEEEEVSDILSYVGSDGDDEIEPMDEDNDSDDDEPTALPRARKMKHVQKQALKPKKKKKNLPDKVDDQFWRPTHQQKLEYNAILRELFRTKYGIDADMAWYQKIPATKAEVDAFEAEEGPGPDLEFRPYPGPGWQTCRWNQVIFNTVLQDFIAECEQRRRPTNDEDYLYTLVFEKFNRGFQAWRKMQAKDGESPEEAHMRNVQEYDKTLAYARTNGNRRNVGGDACMSSEDEGLDTFGNRSHRKRLMPWRPTEVNNAMLQADCLRHRPGVYSSRGAIPNMSLQGFTHTKREAPRGLPISFYNRDWYEQLSEYKKRLLDAAPDDFSWIFKAFRKYASQSTR